MSPPASSVDDGFLRPEEVAELRQTFFDQGRTALEVLGQEVLALEGRVPTGAQLRPLRRAAHTLKGDCASVGFPSLSRLAHAMEDAFATLEGGRRAVSGGQADVLLAAVDTLQSGLDAASVNRPEPAVDLLVERLRGISVKTARSSGAPAAVPGAPVRLTEEQRQRLRDGALQGCDAVQATVELTGQDRQARLAGLLAALSLEVVAQDPPLPAGRGSRVEMVGLAPAGTLGRRLPRLPGVRTRLRDWWDDPAPAGGAAEPSRDGETVRIEARRVDEVLNLIGETVTARATIAGVAAEIEPFLSEELAARLSDAQSLLGHVLQDLQRSAMRMRMVPAARVFRRFSRVARDLGRTTGKRISLHVEGEATELDRGILDALEEPLLHLVRNAVDPAARRAAGKPEEGRITLRASREGNQVLIEVADDGKGIDAAAVRERALLQGGPEGLYPTDEEALQLVFRAGLSTAARVTETSGRGVGLDVVRETVEALRGSIRAANLPEGGASFLMKVPLTVAIIQALLFRVGDREAAVPLASVVEIARAATVVRSIGPDEVCCLRDATLGLARLGRLLGLPESDPRSGYVLVLQSSAGRFGLLVDDLVGEQELVIKAVHDRWVRTPLVAGASVLGRGALALILDVLAVHRASLGNGGYTRA
jgi:two-component system chemotaxis sensor kinase CheA